ncbi:hypothetical protein CHS0354_027338 [Potamilus streckersoni]|uniref:Uncharacterized protein n=1 Tax=Potamilus streckersoni TaxID=2493646 RepID=A0AAE0VS47_9BIVA|nr:hypothetical protein CHS0354_027338 [Potamilus streckersoni]
MYWQILMILIKMFGTAVNPTSLTVGQNEVKKGTVTVNIDPKTPIGLASEGNISRRPYTVCTTDT